MNVFQYGAICEKNWEINLSELNGYKRQYTFYSDFSIAEYCEVWCRDRNAVKKTFNNVIKSWGSSYKALTEIILVLNHKSWSFHGNVDSKYLKCGDEWRKFYEKLYTELYQKAVDKFFKLYTKNSEAVSYYYEITD